MLSVSSMFLFSSISENLLRQIFSELDEIFRRFFIRQKEDLDQRGPGGARDNPSRSPTWTHGQDPSLVLVGPLGPPRRL